MARTKRSIRFSDEEWQEAKRRADEEGVSRAAYVRRRATNQDRQSILAVLAHQLRRINYNAIQIRDRILPYKMRDNGEIENENQLAIDGFMQAMRGCVKRIIDAIAEIDSDKMRLPDRPPRPIGGGKSLLNRAQASSSEDDESKKRPRPE